MRLKAYILHTVDGLRLSVGNPLRGYAAAVALGQESANVAIANNYPVER
jgi:hypothetical protein